jgi:glycine dehydrogenase subunit 1
MDYIPHTDAERAEMLRVIGVHSLDELFSHLPSRIRCGPLNLPAGLSEMELYAELTRLAARNRPATELACFLGAGAYDHYLPPAALELISRGELYTAYTPYQPEISQGLLQLIYEYQTMMAALTGLEVANASLYDGATALLEACQMALRHTGRMRAVVLDGALHPHYLRTVETGLHGLGVAARVIPPRSGTFRGDLDGLAGAANDEAACVAAGYPNFFGAIEDLAPLAEVVHKAGALLVVAANPFACGLLKPPGAMGADIACGEAQSVGVPLQFGGPYLGYLACTKELVRRIPGRLVGQTVDVQGRRAFTLTLQAREQHIRREKATSNICSNEALCALLAHFYLSCVGREGLKRAGELCVAKADLLRRRLKDAKGVKAVPAYPVFHEFVYETEAPAAAVLDALLKRGILGGVDLGRYDPARDHQVLVCVTEKRTEAEIKEYARALAQS